VEKIQTVAEITEELRMQYEAAKKKVSRTYDFAAKG
jgi:hypothetical protein